MSKVTNFFNEDYLTLAPIDKKSYRHLLNLSSNEAHHPHYKQLFDEFIQQYDNDLVTKYPIFKSAHHFASIYHQGDDAEEMLVPGSDFAINLLMNAFNKKAQGLINHYPNYIGYEHYARLQHIVIKEIPRMESNWRSLLTDTLLETTHQLVVITNPEGFLGQVLPYEEVEKIARVCVKQNHILIIDEAYVEFNTFDHAPLLKEFSNVIIVRSYSKGMGVASMRIGVILSSAEIIAYLRRFASENCISDISLSYLEFILERKEILKNIINDIVSARQKLVSQLSNKLPNWHIYDTQTNFITIATRSSEEAAEVTQQLLKEHIRIRHMVEVEDYTHCIRITLPAADRIGELVTCLMDCNTRNNNIVT